MFDDHEKTFKKDVIERLGKAKGRLRQSFPEIQHLIKTSNVVERQEKLLVLRIQFFNNLPMTFS